MANRGKSRRRISTVGTVPPSFLDGVIRKGVSEKVAFRVNGKKEIAMGRENHRTFQKEIQAKEKA